MADTFAPSVFSFHTSAVRVIVRDGEPWFVASDVCAALEYANSRDAVATHLDDDERMTVANSDSHSGKRGGARLMTLINESGLYALVLRSRKPEARKFAKWVTGEVLPSIRKSGGYGQSDPERIKLAFKLAAHASSQVQQTVFDAVMAGDSGWWRQNRYLLAFAYNQDDKFSQPWVKKLDINTMTATVDELPERLNGPDPWSATNEQLARIVIACADKITKRARHEANQQGIALIAKQTESSVL